MTRAALMLRLTGIAAVGDNLNQPNDLRIEFEQGGVMSRRKEKGRCRMVILLCLAIMLSVKALAADQRRTDAGIVEGTVSADGKVYIFKGIPYAAPPVGALRWKAPQPAPSWTGARKATEFRAHCMQDHEDITVFRDNGRSEDCLYLNVWTSATSPKAQLPVMVWIHGGGNTEGAASAPAYDGENLAKKGVVVVSFNYRLGVFGFFSHPDLTRESDHHASGNYGLMDQVAALDWVRRNITTFGGDPGRVTIFGQSAGSFDVCALMASPLAKGLFQRAIGESGAFFVNNRTDFFYTPSVMEPLARWEEVGAQFAESLGEHSVDALRAKPAEELLAAALKHEEIWFQPNIDGYFIPESVSSIYARGQQSQVPLLAGWNNDEGRIEDILKMGPHVQNYIARVGTLFGDRASALLKLYPAATDEQAKRSAQELASDQNEGYITWKWIEMHTATGESPVFRYEFDEAPPPSTSGSSTPSRGAEHSAEIVFVFETLASKNLPWRPEDEKLSDLVSSYWVNFARTGDPNGPGLPRWPAYGGQNGYEVMHLSASPYAAPDEHRARYEFLGLLPQ